MFYFLRINSASIWPPHFGYSHNTSAAGKDAERIEKQEEGLITKERKRDKNRERDY